jgi:hypothetical protein
MKLKEKKIKTKYIVFKILRIKFDIINNKIFLNFSQLLKSIFHQNKMKTLSWKPNQIFLWLKNIFH